MRRSFALVVSAAVAAGAFGIIASPLPAHPPTIVTGAAEKAIGEEIQAFRKSLAEAIARKDVAALRKMYFDGFVHTDTSARQDGKDARIVSLLAGDPVIETAETLELTIRAPSDWTAIAMGMSPIKSSADGKTYAVRWMAVYVRSDRTWMLAASQATRSHEIKP